jgi:hypothetical protein
MDERREIQRTRVHRDVRILLPGVPNPIESTVRNLTSQGAGLSVYTAVLPLTFHLSFDCFRTARLCRLIWRRHEKVGVAFDRG